MIDADDHLHFSRWGRQITAEGLGVCGKEVGNADEEEKQKIDRTKDGAEDPELRPADVPAAEFTAEM